jgi:hypothetical protein
MDPLLPSKVEFTCRIARTEAALSVSYRIENRTDEELGAWNRIRAGRPDGTHDFSPDVVYVDLEGDVLHLRKMALPIPPGLKITAYVAPNASRIPAGGVLEETFTVAIPIRVMHPFKRMLVMGEVVADKPASASRAVVTIGVFVVGTDTRLISEHPAFPDVLSAFPVGPALSRQQLLSAEFPLDPPVAVLDYRGVEWP